MRYFIAFIVGVLVALIAQGIMDKFFGIGMINRTILAMIPSSIACVIVLKIFNE